MLITNFCLWPNRKPLGYGAPSLIAYAFDATTVKGVNLI